MPEKLQRQTTKICEKLDFFCPDCARIGSTDCLDHGGRSNGDSSVLGKRTGDIFDEFNFPSWRGDFKSELPKPATTASTSKEADVPHAVPIDNQSGLESSPEQAAKDESPSGESGGQDGGVRYREKLGKYVVEYRPSRFKWKLWMGTYKTRDEGRRACDCAKYYAGQEKGDYYFKDSPKLFCELGPLTRPFQRVSREARDKIFNQELKRRAKQVIKRDVEAWKANGGAERVCQESKKRAKQSNPGKAKQVIEHIAGPSADYQSADRVSTLVASSQQSHGSLNSEGCERVGLQNEGAGEANDVDFFHGLDPLPLPQLSGLTNYQDGFSADWGSSFYVPSFPLNFGELSPSNRSSSDFTGDESDEDLKLWDYDN